MTKYSEHKNKWISCMLCDLCHRRKKVVLCRGVLPAPILFIGEAPGNSEDVVGQPFKGPAGKLLDSIISAATKDEIRYAMTNLVACIPKGEDNTKTKEPPESAIKACMPRLEELIEMCDPKLVFCVGDLAYEWVPKLSVFDWKCTATFVKLKHPAAILRLDKMKQAIAVQDCIGDLRETLEAHSDEIG